MSCKSIYGYFQNSLDFLLSFFTYSFGIRSLRCSRFGRFTGFNFGLFTITQVTNIFDESRVTRKNGLCFLSGEIRHYGSFEIAQTPGNYYFFFFYRKDKAKLCFLQQDFNSNLWKKLEHELNELQCLHSYSFHCNFNIKTLKPSTTEQVFFSFFFSMVTVLDLNKIMKFLKLEEYYI